ADHRAHADRDRPGPQLRLDLHRDRPPAVGRLRGDGDTHRRLAVGGRGRRVDLDDRLHGALRRPGRRRGQAAARVHPPWRGTLRAAAPRRGRPTAAVHLLTGSTHMDLITVWFVLLAILWTGYLVLEGFDFGVGMLLPVLDGGDGADGETRRRAMLTTIGPHWDGNEVWLITAGGAMFAAFPHWYATMFSGMYLALLLLLVVLILRNMGLEYRHKRTDRPWVRRWDATIIGGSVIAPFVVGVALTNLVAGLPMSEHTMGTTRYTEFDGSLLSLFTPVAI